MAYYLLQLAYTPEGWAAQLQNPQDRVEAVRPVIERLGGSVENGFLAFGEYDAVLLCQFPDNRRAAAFSIAVSSSDAIKAFKTTPLMTIDESLEAIRAAAGAGYQPQDG